MRQQSPHCPSYARVLWLDDTGAYDEEAKHPFMFFVLIILEMICLYYVMFGNVLAGVLSNMYSKMTLQLF